MNFWTDFKQALSEAPLASLRRERWRSFGRTRGSEDPLLGRSRGARGAAVLMNRQRWKGQVPVMLMNGHYRAEMRGGKQHGGSSHEERLSFAPRISVNSFVMSAASPLPPPLPLPPPASSLSTCRRLVLESNTFVELSQPSFSKFPKIPDSGPSLREPRVKT